MKAFPDCLLLAIFATLCSTACGGGLKVNSQWRDHDIVVDGMHDEWQGEMTYVEKKKVAVGFSNDADYLYVSVHTSDRSVERQVMARGLYLWVDPKGGTGHIFGIRFPIGLIEMGGMLRGRGHRADLESMRENFKKSLANLELTLPGEDEPKLMRVNEARGIEVEIGDMQDGLVYEVKIPLRRDAAHPYAVGVESGKSVGVGFETVKFDREQLRGQGGRGGGGFGGGGRGGGFGGGRSGGRGGGRGSGFSRPQIPDQFKLWAKVKLAEQGQSASAEVIQGVVSE